ncbi:unnamed protein product, partial [Mesorhabditis belari]|uniref:Uncharacterized protein n=1 Tax=Mesorhabditis belari TaxID=2138241 RepID=A0AAF3J4A6_9BILA
MESDSLKIPDSTKHVLEARLDNRIASLTVGYAAREKDEIERGFAEFLRQNQKSVDEDLLDHRISQQMERLRESCRTNAINDDYLVEIVEDVGLALQQMANFTKEDLLKAFRENINHFNEEAARKKIPRASVNRLGEDLMRNNAEILMQTFHVLPKEIEATMSALQSYKLWQDLQPNWLRHLKKFFCLEFNWNRQSIDPKRLEDNIIERLGEDPSAAALWTPQKCLLFVDKLIATIKEIEQQLRQTRSDVDLQKPLNDALFNICRIYFEKLAATRKYTREEILAVFNNQISPASMPMICMALRNFPSSQASLWKTQVASPPGLKAGHRDPQ